jgi:molybdopterin converting factor small subunit
MKVRVKLFAAAKELTRSDTLEVELPPGATIDDLRRAAVIAAPALETLMSHSLWAVNSNYVSGDTVLNETSDVAMIPPVSGG